jgi:hypothetical protein
LIEFFLCLAKGLSIHTALQDVEVALALLHKKDCFAIGENFGLIVSLRKEEMMMNRKVVLAVALLFTISLGLAFVSVQSALAVECKAGYNFIGNTTTKVFHLPSCPSAKQISDKNAAFYKTCKGAMKSGYTPCKICKPGSASSSGTPGTTPTSPAPKATTNPTGK